jgi:lipoate-protein ligase A
MSAWRLLVDGAADGAWNMAVDEALLESCASGEGAPRAPTLRLYGWRPPALSLGRRQGAQGAHDPGYLRSEGIDLVRRPTGGRAVLHEHERTYAVVGRLHAAPFEGGVLDTYARIAAALVEALRALGIEAAGARAPQGVGPDPGPSGFPVCFDHVGAHEISVDGRKIVGSAQLRRRGAFLQHGSILIRSDPARVSAATGAPVRSGRFVGISDVLAREVDPREIDAEVAAAFARVLAVELRHGVLSTEELRRARELRLTKYSDPIWGLEGELPSAVSGGPRQRPG